MTNKLNNEEFWREFIHLYRSLPATWKIKSEMYKDKMLKHDCYVKLTNKLKEIDPTADINTTKKKINILRSNYRRELKKVLASEKSGADIDDIYLPSVWYFDEFKFLRDHEIQITGKSTTDEDETFLNTSMQQSQNITSENTVRNNLMLYNYTVKTRLIATLCYLSLSNDRGKPILAVAMGSIKNGS
jgi:hypothetical protein